MNTINFQHKKIYALHTILCDPQLRICDTGTWRITNWIIITIIIFFLPSVSIIIIIVKKSRIFCLTLRHKYSKLCITFCKTPKSAYWKAPQSSDLTEDISFGHVLKTLVGKAVASADRTVHCQFQATGQPVSRMQASDAMTSWLPIELLFLSLTAEVLQGKMCQNSLPSGGGGSVSAKISGGRGCPSANILISLERQLIALQLCR